MYILDQWYSLRLEDIIHISICNYIWLYDYICGYIYIITPKIRSAILFPGWAPFSHLQLQPACGEPRGDFASKLPTSLLSPPPEPDPPGYFSMFSMAISGIDFLWYLPYYIRIYMIYKAHTFCVAKFQGISCHNNFVAFRFSWKSTIQAFCGGWKAVVEKIIMELMKFSLVAATASKVWKKDVDTMPPQPRLSNCKYQWTSVLSRHIVTEMIGRLPLLDELQLRSTTHAHVFSC